MLRSGKQPANSKDGFAANLVANTGMFASNPRIPFTTKSINKFRRKLLKEVYQRFCLHFNSLELRNNDLSQVAEQLLQATARNLNTTTNALMQLAANLPSAAHSILNNRITFCTILFSLLSTASAISTDASEQVCVATLERGNPAQALLLLVDNMKNPASFSSFFDGLVANFSAISGATVGSSTPLTVSTNSQFSCDNQVSSGTLNVYSGGLDKGIDLLGELKELLKIVGCDSQQTPKIHHHQESTFDKYRDYGLIALIVIISLCFVAALVAFGVVLWQRCKMEFDPMKMPLKRDMPKHTDKGTEVLKRAIERSESYGRNTSIAIANQALSRREGPGIQNDYGTDAPPTDSVDVESSEERQKKSAFNMISAFIRR